MTKLTLLYDIARGLAQQEYSLTVDSDNDSGEIIVTGRDTPTGRELFDPAFVLSTAHIREEGRS